MIDLTMPVLESPESAMSDLTYSCYVYNRDFGMSAESALSLWPETGELMEARYESETSVKH
jgi:hypothetical protein